MSQPLLLDTCAAIWLVNGDDIDDATLTAIEASQNAKEPLLVSAITAWEVATLVAKARISMAIPVEIWWQKLVDHQAIECVALSPDILIRSTTMPGTPPSDPADRMVIATARDIGATVVTRDRKILDYGDDGHVSVMRC
jgi:PIN domain nuclease of toxin-antitoxin system